MHQRHWEKIVEEQRAEIDRLRAVLKPFAEFYSLCERNGYLKDLALWAHASAPNWKTIGAAFGAAELKAAADALEQKAREGK